MKPYPKYKDSGIEWLGEVPEDWKVKKIKYIFLLITEKAVDISNKIALENIESQTGKFIKTDTLFEGEGVKFRTNDLLYGKLRPYLAKVYIADFEGSAVGDFFVLRGCSEIYSRFFLYKLLERNFTDLADSSTFGAKMPRVSWEFLSDMIFSYPSLSEQTAIAAFLDRKTAEIDSIISKKERLIELYEEEKAAVINHAVTKGLDPDAKMKDSGIEWLGEIPEHWETAELRRYINFITSGSRGWAEHYSDEGKIFVRIGNLTRNSIGLDLSDIQRVQPPDGAEGERTKIEKGDILFSITAYIGSVAVATDEIVGAYINQHIALVRPCLKKIYPQFVAYLACSNFGQIQLIEQGYGGTKVQLSLDDVKSLRIPVAPLKEQLAIIQHIETKCSKIDALISKFKRQIELLKEYSTALISEAVTGKIDVRNEI